MNGYKINDNLYINCNNVDYVSFLNDKVKIHMNDNTSYYITQDQYAEIETKIPQNGGGGGGSSGGGANITSNIKIVDNKSSVLSSNHNKLCILSDTGDLSFKVVDKIEGGNEEISTLSEVLPQGFKEACCARYNNNIYIFGGYGSSEYLNTIYKFNCITKTITTLSVTLPQILARACCAIYNENIYIFGGFGAGRSNTIYKFNCTNETITTLSATLPQGLEYACCAIYENYIYIFGGIGDNGTSGNIYRFNCTYESIITLSVKLTIGLYSLCCSTYNDNIYIFGGSNSSAVASNYIYKFNCVNVTITTLTTVLPQGLFYASCSIHNDNIYIFGGYNGTSIVNTIYKFNCTNESIITLSNTLPQRLYNLWCSTYNDNIYIFGGSPGGKDYSKAIYNFLISFELTANNVLIYNANSNYSFDLITDQVTIPIKKVYIGDSNNKSQLANAYLYDQAQSAWVNVNTGKVLS